MRPAARIGVLAVQGGFAAHVRALRELGHEALEVRDPAHLEHLDGLVLPGGESTTQLKLIARAGLREGLDRHVAAGKPVLATCAGLILAARCVTHPVQDSFGWLDVSVARNAWGRQLDSFEAVADGTDLPMTFIRAPRIVERTDEVEVLATFEGEPVWVRQGAFHGATFHPELTRDRRVHAAVFGAARPQAQISMPT